MTWIDNIIKRRHEKRKVGLPSLEEYIQIEKEIQASIKMQAFSLLIMILIAFIVLKVMENIYIENVYQNKIEELRITAAANTKVIADHIELDNIVKILQEPDAMTKEAKLVNEKFNLYALMLNAKYVYLMLKPENSIEGLYIDIAPFASEEIRGIPLNTSVFPMRMPFINGYPEAFKDPSFWDDVADYQTPGPIQAMEEEKPNASKPIVGHPRRGNLI